MRRYALFIVMAFLSELPDEIEKLRQEQQQVRWLLQPRTVQVMDGRAGLSAAEFAMCVWGCE